LIYCRDTNSGLRSAKALEAFWWSRIANDTRGRSRIFCLTPTLEVQLDHFLHHAPKLGIHVESVEFLMKLLLKEWILDVYHDFHWVLVATKFLAAKHHSLYVNELESDIWKCRSWSGNFGEVGVEVRHFTSDSATLDAITEWWRLLAWSWWCNFVTRIFLLITNSQWG